MSESLHSNQRIYSALPFCQLGDVFSRLMLCCVWPQAGSEDSSVCKREHSTPERRDALSAGDGRARSHERRLTIGGVVTRVVVLSSLVTLFLHFGVTFQRGTCTTQPCLRGAALQCGRWPKNTWRWSENTPPVLFPSFAPTSSSSGTTRTCPFSSCF